MIDRIQKKQLKNLRLVNPENNEPHPVLNVGIFVGTFNFNLAQIVHAMMSGSFLEKSLQSKRVNVLFDTNNNRILL